MSRRPPIAPAVEARSRPRKRLRPVSALGERRLAGAGFADDAEDLAGLDGRG